MSQFLAHFPWYVHVAMSVALVMAALFLALTIRGHLGRKHEPDDRDDRAKAVDRVLARLDEVERRLLLSASEHRQMARADWELVQRQLVGVVRDLEAVAGEVRQLLPTRRGAK